MFYTTSVHRSSFQFKCVADQRCIKKIDTLKKIYSDDSVFLREFMCSIEIHVLPTKHILSPDAIPHLKTSSFFIQLPHSRSQGKCDAGCWNRGHATSRQPGEQRGSKSFCLSSVVTRIINTHNHVLFN